MINNLKNKKKKGFTLIELIIVIAIIAILAVLAIPKFGEVRKNANTKSDIANAKTIANAVTSLIADGKIELGAGDIVVTKGGIGDAKDIEDYLQNVPTLKSETGNFKVTIDDKGGVTVSTDKLIYFPTDDGAPKTISTTTP
ncbi:prepilin-type N-terminal cleavage/methylation domain-containing protein [Clostridium sp.]|uniref:prepilin-type N-terminal cleavage/methylation domain-containing protein n=1 Tax=Clostridium sp. TaxID=1506 RepID=UPI002A80E517|nr:prepilin-type N-terminal cleavage/methylation domain-containing protein [Clostridium sp.]MDY4251647.1 prepilin-type N-terminal cleavage/methylation domain-containing protein [Clostridium sp.]